MRGRDNWMGEEAVVPRSRRTMDLLGQTFRWEQGREPLVRQPIYKSISVLPISATVRPSWLSRNDANLLAIPDPVRNSAR